MHKITTTLDRKQSNSIIIINLSVLLSCHRATLKFPTALEGITVPLGVLLSSRIDPRLADRQLLCQDGVCWVYMSVVRCFWLKTSGILAALMFRAANLKTIGKAGTGW